MDKVEASNAQIKVIIAFVGENTTTVTPPVLIVRVKPIGPTLKPPSKFQWRIDEMAAKSFLNPQTNTLFLHSSLILGYTFGAPKGNHVHHKRVPLRIDISTPAIHAVQNVVHLSRNRKRFVGKNQILRHKGRETAAGNCVPFGHSSQYLHVASPVPKQDPTWMVARAGARHMRVRVLVAHLMVILLRLECCELMMRAMMAQKIGETSNASDILADHGLILAVKDISERMEAPMACSFPPRLQD